MPHAFTVTSTSGDYRVEIGADLLARALAENTDALVLCDANLASYLPALATPPILIEALETNKALEAIPQIIIAMRQRGANRKTHLLVVGGGVIQDIATFAASIYMRGITWTYLPTTLLGMVDSCIGGKSSINVMGYKNLIGNFYPPREILVDSAFIATLDAEKVVGGLYEAAKICYARSFDDFNQYLAQGPGFPLAPEAAERVILKSLTTKKWFIETDEFDNAERLLLNFGHTFGHAMEAATDFGVTHGVAVGLGMLIAIDYAQRRGELNALGAERTQALAAHVKAMLGRDDTSIVAVRPTLDLQKVLEKFGHDKKHRTDAYRMVIPRGDGALELVAQPRSDAVHADILAAYANALGSVGWHTATNA